MREYRKALLLEAKIAERSWSLRPTKVDKELTRSGRGAVRGVDEECTKSVRGVYEDYMSSWRTCDEMIRSRASLSPYRKEWSMIVEIS